LPEAVTQILHKIFEKVSASSIAALLLDLRDAAESAQSRVARFVA
jgi:hypothetical protein